MSGTTSSGASGQFQVQNGQIIDPNGTVFRAQGINLYDSQMGNAGQVLADFPGLNFVRLNVYSYQSPDAYSAFIQTMTAAGVVVELEDHTNSSGSNAGGGVGSAFTGSQLTNELNWFSSVASAFASNPYVWFGTNNEPPAGGLDTWEQQTYNAVRGTGNHSPVMIELPGGGYPGSTASGYGMDPNIFTSMTNIVLDPHYYGWDSGYSTDQQTVNASLTSLVQGAQSLRSADGTVPAIIGEYGPSTDGVSTDGNASQVFQAVQQSTVTSGGVAWGWNSGANDNLTDGSGNLTSYGQEVAGSFNTNPAPKPPIPAAAAAPAAAPAPAPVVTPSANDTVVAAGSTAAIIDVSGNKWTINSGGQVAVNGAADTTTGNVVELAYVNGTVWQENTANLWWGKTSPTDTWNGGTATSPLPVVAPPAALPPVTPPPSPTVAPSANDTVVTAGSSAAIVDASGNTWTITSGGQVAVNGTADATTANVVEIANVNGTIWQENTANLWWGKTSPTDTWNGGTATSPLPVVTPPPAAAVVPSADGTVVNAGSSAAIVDASGNTWTITSGGQVAVNGTADATTANVVEIANVNGTIWQENTANLWWGKTSPTDTWTGGTATSPLPATVTIPQSQTNATISASGVTVTATAGNHMVFISGQDDTVSLSGGNNSITDTGGGNTFVIPAAGDGYDTFMNNILTNGDTLDLSTVLAATQWDGADSTLSKFLDVTNTPQAMVLQVAPGGAGMAMLTINGAQGSNLAGLLAHAIT